MKASGRAVVEENAPGVRAAERALARWFIDRSGHVRTPHLDRRKDLGPGWHTTYKKGWEARLIAASHEELAGIRSLLRQCGFKVGRPFAKSAHWAQPVYGRDQVKRLIALVERERSRPRATR